VSLSENDVHPRLRKGMLYRDMRLETLPAFPDVASP